MNRLRLVLGWICYVWLMRQEFRCTRLQLWALSWAGLYANQDSDQQP